MCTKILTFNTFYNLQYSLKVARSNTLKSTELRQYNFCMSNEQFNASKCLGSYSKGARITYMHLCCTTNQRSKLPPSFPSPPLLLVT